MRFLSMLTQYFANLSTQCPIYHFSVIFRRKHYTVFNLGVNEKNYKTNSEFVYLKSPINRTLFNVFFIVIYY